MWNISSPYDVTIKDNPKWETEPLINEDLINEINTIEYYDKKKSQQWMNDYNVSEVARLFENADEREILAVCYIAVRKFPEKYLAILSNYISEKEKK